MQGQIGSPAPFLASLFFEGMEHLHLLLLTGSTGTAESTWCFELTRQPHLCAFNAKEANFNSVLSRGLKKINNQVEIPLGERCGYSEGCNRSRSEALAEPIKKSNWFLGSSVITSLDCILEQPENTETFILREPGPSEFLNEEGIITCMEKFDAHYNRLLSIAVHLPLLRIVQERSCVPK